MPLGMLKSRSPWRIPSALATVCGVAALLLAAPCADGAASPMAAPAAMEGAQVIAVVNAQRTANGIPPITVDRPSFGASWCPDESAPFSTGEAARVSAPEDDYWSTAQTPYSTAPLHQFMIYNPAFTVAGDVHMADGTDCMGLGEASGHLPVRQSAEAASLLLPTFYAFVNERGPLAAVTSELAREGPTTPQQQVGDPANRVTGPQISLFVLGFGTYPTPGAVSLSTASGTPVPGVRVAGELDGGVLVAPPLASGTAYVLSVQWTARSGQVATQMLHFATSTSANAVAIRLAARRGRRVTLVVRSQSPDARLQLTGRRRITYPLAAGRHSQDVRVALPTAGRWRACVSSGGGASGYPPGQRCVSFTVPA